MRYPGISPSCFLLLLAACGTASSSAPSGAAPASAVQADAETFTAHGMTVARPSDWVFVPADKTVFPDTVVLLQGPIGKAKLAPVAEIARRPLSAADRRRSASHILTALATEIVQSFESFDATGAPVDTEIGGRPAARLDMSLVEALPEGGSEDRKGAFYGVVDGEQIWMVRCLGPSDGSADESCQKIVSSIRF